MSILKKFADGLNEPQAQAVATLNGPLLILAGAGSGKTRVLTYRMANLIAQGEATADQILAVTFTNKAAREMESRVVKLLQELGIPVYERMWVSTFHSICARILREDIHLLDYQPFFAIYDDSDQMSLLRKVLQILNINEKMYPARSFQARINEAKQLAQTPEDLGKKGSMWWDERSIEVYRIYEQELKKANALDFGDLLFKTYELFRTYPDILLKYQERFQYISVDEYQDTNHIQYLIVKQLAELHRNLCVVGDEDQSIYSWRGADIRNILSFEQDFPEAKVIKLEENYRSSGIIVRAASDLIKNNTQRKDKTLFTSNEDGDKIWIHEDTNEYEEARFVVQNIESLMSSPSEGLSYSDFAVFYRTNAQSRVLEDLMRGHNIPYKLVGGVRFYERMEIKDVLAYLRSFVNPADDVAVERIINVPARGIGKTTVEKIEEYGIKNKMTFYDSVLAAAEHRLVNTGAARKLRDFRHLMDGLAEKAKTLKLSELFVALLDATEYVIRLKEENTPESQARIDNLEEFANAIRQFEQERGEEATLTNFLEEMALVSDADQVEDGVNTVTLMTLHISKGLEFPVVFIVGMEEGLFPSSRAIDDADPTSVEEERRLAYVGMTRARRKLFLTYARQRRVWGQEQIHKPSRFLEDIPETYVHRHARIQRPAFLDRYRDKYGSAQATASSPSGSTSMRPERRRSISAGGPENFDVMPDYENAGNDSGGTRSYEKGMRVRHPTFGVGSIYQVEGQGEMQKVSVVFQDQTFKKFVVKYARLEIV
ncbi:MAG: UvrD-helicase domain-containing protein [Bdellovibrionales bacterium]|nr:UvrD-helicase domain-containing protein [Bdellovibrionales bacterium]